MEEDDETAYPRTPPARSFDKLAASGIRLGAEKYVACSREAPRYDSYDYTKGKNSPRWSDEERFYKWLMEAEIPRELAEMLYFHAPEVSFLLGPGHIMGVESIIEDNDITSDPCNLRAAGFFQLARGPNGDLVVVSLHPERMGEVGYLPHGEVWGGDIEPQEMQDMFITVMPSIGDFFDAFENKGENEPCDVPSDYFDALDKKES